MGDEKRRKRYDAIRQGKPDPEETMGSGFGASRGPAGNYDAEKLKK